MKTYITFGQDHTHRVNNITFDCDCVASIEAEDATAGRERAFELFGPKFAFSYLEEEIKKYLHFFPRGILIAQS